MWTKERDAMMKSIIDHLNKDTDRIEKMGAEFRARFECPNREKCEYFEFHSIVEENGHFADSRSGYYLGAVRCKYQIKSKREGKHAPRGLDEGCSYEGDIGPAIVVENFPFQRGMGEY